MGARPAQLCRSQTVIGQSYRLTREPEHFPRRHRPDRPLFRYRRPDPASASAGSSTSPTAIRLDKDNLAVRRNELDLTVGTDLTYAQIGYLRLNRDITPTIEDLRDKEELRLAGRVSSLATGRCSARPCST